MFRTTTPEIKDEEKLAQVAALSIEIPTGFIEQVNVSKPKKGASKSPPRYLFQTESSKIRRSAVHKKMQEHQKSLRISSEQNRKSSDTKRPASASDKKSLRIGSNSRDTSVTSCSWFHS